MQARRPVGILEGGDWREEVARVGQAVGADRPAFRQRERAAVVFAQVAARRTVAELDPNLDAARDHRALAGFDVDDAELGPQPQLALLLDEQHLAVGVVEVLVLHRARDEIHVRAHAGLRAGVAGGGDRAHALEKRLRRLRERQRIPAHRGDRHVHLVTRRGPPRPDVGFLEPADVRHGRPDAVQPRPLVAGPRRGERRTAQLLGVEAIRALLWRVAANRQGARQGLGFEAVAEARHVAGGDGRLSSARGVGGGRRVIDVVSSMPNQLSRSTRISSPSRRVA